VAYDALSTAFHWTVRVDLEYAWHSCATSIRASKRRRIAALFGVIDRSTFIREKICARNLVEMPDVPVAPNRARHNRAVCFVREISARLAKSGAKGKLQG
jgi:hypothetical protein